MNMAAPLSPLSLSLVFNPKPLYLFTAPKPFSPLRSSSPALPPIPTSFNLNLPKRWKISAVNYDFLLSEASPVESSQQMVATSDDGVSTIISSLLFVAFLGLSVLTIGVIYIAVTDFLQKREGEKFEKEEAAKKKRRGKSITDQKLQPQPQNRVNVTSNTSLSPTHRPKLNPKEYS